MDALAFGLLVCCLQLNRQLLLAKNLEGLSDSLLISLLTPSSTPDGERLSEGDMLIAESVGVKALPGRGSIWSSRSIPYEFHSSVSSNTSHTIEKAMSEWSSVLCVQFVPREDQNNYLTFRTDNPGCYTLVGRKHSEGQDVNLGEGCEHFQIVMHEIGHSLGFFHEHSRKDRSGTLKILWQHILPGMTSQFNTGNDFPRDVPYDVTSVMHYSPMAFSNQIFERNTMVSHDPHLQPLIGKARGITFRDAKLANIIYRCQDLCANEVTSRCQNEGYLAPAEGEMCQCVCPPNTKGQFCEEVVGTYYDAPECGGDVFNEGVIETPGYPGRTKGKGSCTWKLQAPSGLKVAVDFLDFNFSGRSVKEDSPYKGLCVYEQIELRTSDGDVGHIYCGTDIEPSTRIVSTSNVFWILISSNGKGEGRGLKARISHV